VVKDLGEEEPGNGEVVYDEYLQSFPDHNNACTLNGVDVWSFVGDNIWVYRRVPLGQGLNIANVWQYERAHCHTCSEVWFYPPDGPACEPRTARPRADCQLKCSKTVNGDANLDDFKAKCPELATIMTVHTDKEQKLPAFAQLETTQQAKVVFLRRDGATEEEWQNSELPKLWMAYKQDIVMQICFSPAAPSREGAAVSA